MKLFKVVTVSTIAAMIIVTLYLFIPIGGNSVQIAHNYTSLTSKSEFSSFLSDGGRDQWIKDVDKASTGSYGGDAILFPLSGKKEEDVYKVILRWGVDAPDYVNHAGVDANIWINGKQPNAIKSTTDYYTASNEEARTLVVAPTDGVIRKVKGLDGSYGNAISMTMLDTDGSDLGFVATLAHMQAVNPEIKPGDKVTKGQILGLVGSTGVSSGNHVHFELHIDSNSTSDQGGGARVNPYTLLPSDKGGEPDVPVKYCFTDMVDEVATYCDYPDNYSKKNPGLRPENIVENSNGYKPKIVS